MHTPCTSFLHWLHWSELPNDALPTGSIRILQVKEDGKVPSLPEDNPVELLGIYYKATSVSIKKYGNYPQAPCCRAVFIPPTHPFPQVKKDDKVPLPLEDKRVDLGGMVAKP